MDDNEPIEDSRRHRRQNYFAYGTLALGLIGSVVTLFCLHPTHSPTGFQIATTLVAMSVLMVLLFVQNTVEGCFMSVVLIGVVSVGGHSRHLWHAPIGLIVTNIVLAYVVTRAFRFYDCEIP